MRHAIPIALLLLAACEKPKPVAVTIPNLAAYVVMQRCGNGLPAVLNPGCPDAAPQKASDPMLVRRMDWSRPNSGQAQDTWIDAAGHYVNSFSYAPNREFVAANGDGGDVVTIDGNSARFSFTQNGTANGGTESYKWDCGADDGWMLFDDRAPTGRWDQKVALVGATCLPAYTRWRKEQAPVPFEFNGARGNDLPMSIVISEHFDNGVLGTAHSMERTVHAEGYGRVLWESWHDTPRPVPATAQCPGVIPWSDAPVAGWSLWDRRCMTNVVAGDGSMTGDRFGWPPLF